MSLLNAWDCLCCVVYEHVVAEDELNWPRLDLMVLKLSYHRASPIPLEIEGFTPDWARDRSLAEIEEFQVFHGNQSRRLGEFFSISGDASDQEIAFEGDLSGVHYIGAQMKAGRIRVHGPVGRHTGSEMAGGEMIVDGDAGLFLGAEMHGGQIHVRGNAGNLVGARYRGSDRGMTGGTILVDGNAGNEVGVAMRRGLIAIGGSVGDVVGFNMIAGTILVFGTCGRRPGAGMRRGTIGVFGLPKPELLPSFRLASQFQPQFLRVILKSLAARGLRFDASLLESTFSAHRGDFVSLGRGEILFRHSCGTSAT
ncbi:formylmethanofuran dehydrogenase subunit C [Schlesneria paludicola]|uniref:formylmethanofuran dehydrogenase subunit C n=1 Tax=Schlesneria paludicola TaxID=360056 RepID=UPI00029A86EA|nr:formylmethanofuran dehydrogenase subunit C [Schlesneria paludicola]